MYMCACARLCVYVCVCIIVQRTWKCYKKKKHCDRNLENNCKTLYYIIKLRNQIEWAYIYHIN